MIYHQFQDKKLSALGFGMMRLPLKDGYIDEEETARLVEYAIENGVNYFDTAWGYLNGQSEIVTGKVLKKYSRDRYYLASKFPGYDLSNIDKVEEIFEKQLQKCGVDYFDFYLFHNVCEKNVDAYLDSRYRILEYLLKQKENGRIKHLGFSTHADTSDFLRFLDAYGAHMEFCQIQLNYLDYSFQNAKEKVEILNARNIPIWVMEPIRGGKLANLTEEQIAPLKALRADETAPSWAFRFLQDIPGVTVTLSGMSDFEQVKQNVETFSEYKPLNDTEKKELFALANRMINSVPCTACSYCTEYCPQGLDIPKLISLYNEHVFTGGGFILSMAISALAEGKRPSACLACGACEGVCPQKIKISEVFADFKERLK